MSVWCRTQTYHVSDSLKLRVGFVIPKLNSIQFVLSKPKLLRHDYHLMHRLAVNQAVYFLSVHRELHFVSTCSLAH